MSELDFAYPFSLDGHVFRTANILPRMEAVEFHNPNELEAVMQVLPLKQPKYEEHSCLVGIPHNRVGPNYNNRNGGGTAKELNDRWLAGERIDLERMDFSNIIGVHQEVEYVFAHV